MATSRATLRHARQLRVVIDDSVEQALADLVKAWGVAWDAVADEWRLAVAELAAVRVDGRWPSRTVILRNARVQAAMQITSAKLDELSRNSGIRILQGVPDLLSAQEDALLNLIGSQVPDSVTVDWARVSDRQLEAVVKRCTGRVESKLKPLPRDVSASMKQELIRGVAVGTNPNRVADLLMKRFGARFNGGLWRARSLCRTEMLEATRDAALVSRKENRAVLAGWRWLCALSARTCPSCLAMNGRLFGVDEPGPDDHQCGRCTAVPVTKTWAELGIDAPEPVSQFPDAKAWFGQQPAKVQQQIMGDKRLTALNSGKLSWDRIPVARQTPGWRRSYVPAAA